jgi:hypothetical protein
LPDVPEVSHPAGDPAAIHAANKFTAARTFVAVIEQQGAQRRGNRNGPAIVVFVFAGVATSSIIRLAALMTSQTCAPAP